MGENPKAIINITRDNVQISIHLTDNKLPFEQHTIIQHPSFTLLALFLSHVALDYILRRFFFSKNSLNLQDRFQQNMIFTMRQNPKAIDNITRDNVQISIHLTDNKLPFEQHTIIQHPSFTLQALLVFLNIRKIRKQQIKYHLYDA